MPRIVAWIGVAASVALVILCVIALAGCQMEKINTNPWAPCPHGEHRLKVGADWKCCKDLICT